MSFAIRVCVLQTITISDKIIMSITLLRPAIVWYTLPMCHQQMLFAVDFRPSASHTRVYVPHQD
jgi:hypothetical protein